MKLATMPFVEQVHGWPETGRHILAHFDDETIIVYQAYRPSIGEYAIRHQRFGGDFKYSRMSWIKPNFLWMMYRSDWGRSEGQDVVLAVRLRREFFDSLLELAVPSAFVPGLFADHDEWKKAVGRSDVRLQWDPDHLPTGMNCERRAIQLGLQGDALQNYGHREVLDVIDMSDFVTQQRRHAEVWKDGSLLTPVENVYVPASSRARQNIGLD